jgi:hypothetical protein
VNVVTDTYRVRVVKWARGAKIVRFQGARFSTAENVGRHPKIKLLKLANRERYFTVVYLDSLWL